MRRLFYKIKQILSNGLNIIYKKIFHTDSDMEAYSEETNRIKEIGINNLCNIIEDGLHVSEKMYRFLGEKKKGKHNPFFGKTHTEENKKLFAGNAKKLHTGKKRSEEARKHLSEGISKSEKHKAWRKTIKSDEYKKMYSEKSKKLWNDPVWREKNIKSLKGRKSRSKVYTDEYLMNTYKAYLDEKEKTNGRLSYMKYYKNVGISSPQYFHSLAKNLVERL